MPRNLKIIRQNRGFSLKSLAAISGVGASTIGNFENGKTEMSEGSLKMLAEALECEVDDLTAESAPTKPSEIPPDGEPAWVFRIEKKVNRLLQHLGIDPDGI